MMKFFIIVLGLIWLPVSADQFYEEATVQPYGYGKLHWLSTMDVINHGESLLPPGTYPITDAQAAIVQAAYQSSLPPVVNPQGFITAVKGIFGGTVAILGLPQTLQNAITLCIAAINEGNWTDVQAIIISQQSALNAASVSIYPAIRNAATSNNIPITLP